MLNRSDLRVRQPILLGPRQWPFLFDVIDSAADDTAGSLDEAFVKHNGASAASNIL